MGTMKQVNIKNRTYYFYNDIIDLENFDVGLLKTDKKSYKDISIYNIGYITKRKINDCKNINSVNPLHLNITHANGYVEEIDGIRSKIKKISDDEFDDEKDYIKIKFNSDDDLPLNKQFQICF